MKDWGDEVEVDVELGQARPEDYDGLVLPGGQINPDKLRLEPAAVDFVRAFFEAGKPVGAICHGPWLLVEADVARGRTLTSYASIRTDLRNAGAEWVDREVVVDQGLVTSRNPGDLDGVLRQDHRGVRGRRAPRAAPQRLSGASTRGGGRSGRCAARAPAAGGIAVASARSTERLWRRVLRLPLLARRTWVVAILPAYSLNRRTVWPR